MKNFTGKYYEDNFYSANKIDRLCIIKTFKKTVYLTELNQIKRFNDT